MNRISVWLLSKMPFAYLCLVNANPSHMYRPQGSVSSSNYMQCVDNVCWQADTSKMSFLDMFYSPIHSLEG